MTRSMICFVAGLAVAGCAANTTPPGQPSVPAQATGTASTASAVTRTVVTDARYQLSFYTALHADCTSMGYPIVRIVTAPAHGSLTTEEATDYPFYAKDNQRYDCNLRRVPGTRLFYQSEPNFSGADTGTVEVIYPSAEARTITFALTVR
jgi:hypothetical protein